LRAQANEDDEDDDRGNKSLDHERPLSRNLISAFSGFERGSSGSHVCTFRDHGILVNLADFGYCYVDRVPFPSTMDSPASPISACCAGVTDNRAARRDRSATRILAKSLVCELLAAGLDTHDLIALAAEFVDQVTRRASGQRRHGPDEHLEHDQRHDVVADDHVAPASGNASRAASERSIAHLEVHTPHPSAHDPTVKPKAR